MLWWHACNPVWWQIQLQHVLWPPSDARQVLGSDPITSDRVLAATHRGNSPLQFEALGIAHFGSVGVSKEDLTITLLLINP